MRVDQFDYNLPKNRIAQSPHKPRDHARLLVLDRRTGGIDHRRFDDLPSILRRGDVVVVNDSKVIRARLMGKKPTDGKLEIFLLRKIGGCEWEALVGGHGAKPKMKISLSSSLAVLLLKRKGRIWRVKFLCSEATMRSWIRRHGQLPLPPYIKQQAKSAEYQTVYARSEGSVAAPTAGLHFTPRLIKRLTRAGVQIEHVTLHVGLGTFAPVTVLDTRDHHMHPEFASINSETCHRLNQAKREGRRIIGVGTTVVRTLEAFTSPSGKITSGSRNVNLFITPGYHFKFVDAMVTNFHLPKSTLLMLVSAFAGRANILAAYQMAIRRHYRFFSFGDAMLILDELPS